MINGQLLTFLEDKTVTEYVVRGVDPVSDRMWVCVTDKFYDGYDGDLIVSAKDGQLIVRQQDERASLPRLLTPVLICPIIS